MDFTDEEICQMLGERLHERTDLASHARAELAKAPAVSGYNHGGDKAALFLVRICVLIQHVRNQLEYPSEQGGWITGDRLRAIIVSVR